MLRHILAHCPGSLVSLINIIIDNYFLRSNYPHSFLLLQLLFNYNREQTLEVNIFEIVCLLSLHVDIKFQTTSRKIIKRLSEHSLNFKEVRTFLRDFVRPLSRQEFCFEYFAHQFFKSFLHASTAINSISTKQKVCVSIQYFVTLLS